ncbi:OsmC family protein [Candidatus Bathyarchaeota archaeon]|nr:OsmC family protein [Candidatus Bathyarchaeota archaeon]
MAKIVARSKIIDNVRSVGDDSRTHTIVCDLPVDKGGTDMGPTALEIAMIALADCAVTIYADVAKRSKIEITSLEAVAECEKQEGSPTITNVKLKVKVSGKAREHLLRAAWRRTEQNCPVIRIFREPIPVESEFEVVQSQ